MNLDDFSVMFLEGPPVLLPLTYLTIPVSLLMLFPLMIRRCKTPVPEIQTDVGDATSPEQAVKLRQYLAHIDELIAHRKEIEPEILQIAELFSAILNYLYTLLGLDKNPMGIYKG